MPLNDASCPVDLEAAKERVMGDMEFLKEMLGVYEESVPTFMDAIRDAIEQRDGATLSKTAHQFKGVSLNLSVLQIAEKAADLDELGKNADFETSEEVFKDLELAVTNFREFMKKVTW